MKKLAVVLCIIVLQSVWSSRAEEKPTYQLAGKVVQGDGRVLRATGTVYLHAATPPYILHTQLDLGGEFKFKRLPEGVYTVVVAMPKAGEVRKTVEVRPSFADSQRRIRTVFSFERRERSAARQTVSAAELSIPASARAEYDKAQQLLETSETACAIVHLKRAVELAPQFASAWNALGTLSFQDQEYEAAEKYFREALQQDPELYASLVNLGRTLLLLHRYDDALKLSREAVEDRPDDAFAHAQLGQSYFHLGRLQEAENHLKLAESLDPGHFSYPQLTLSKIYQQMEKYTSAIQELQEFLTLHPDSKLVPNVRRELDRLTTSGF